MFLKGFWEFNHGISLGYIEYTFRKFGGNTLNTSIAIICAYTTADLFEFVFLGRTTYKGTLKKHRAFINSMNQYIGSPKQNFENFMIANFNIMMVL